MNSATSLLRIATRSSELALWQARHVADLLQKHHPGLSIELVDVTTQGDIDQSQPLRNFGGMGVFTKEVQRAVLNGKADLAVHSLKDLPTEILEPELTLAAVPERELRWDAILLPLNSPLTLDAENPLASLPKGCKIGSGSLRRQAQIKAARPDVSLLEIRGNLNTRLRKLDSGEYEALILAAAGVLRLGWEERLSSLLPPPLMYPAVGQGALGLECRTSDSCTIELLQPLNDPEARLCTTAERALLASLRAGCHAPVGVFCQRDGARLFLTATVLTPQGDQQILATLEADLPEDLSAWPHLLPLAEQLGRDVAAELITQGAQALMDGPGAQGEGPKEKS